MTYTVQNSSGYNVAVSIRAARMLDIILEHQESIEQYEQGQLVLHFRGNDVKAQLDKVALCVKTDDN